MLILNGYYHFPVTVDNLREATVNPSRAYSQIGARGEANSWNGKVYIPDRELKMPGAVGVFSDKFGFWSIIDFILKRDELSFGLASDHRADKKFFSLKKKDAEYWGKVRTVGTAKERPLTANCIATEVAGFFIPSQGIPDDMFVPPKNLH